jgi:hypothetical protein
MAEKIAAIATLVNAFGTQYLNEESPMSPLSEMNRKRESNSA